MTVKHEKVGAECLESPGSAVARSGPPLWAQWVPAKPPGALSGPPHTSARSPPTEGGSEASAFPISNKGDEKGLIYRVVGTKWL